MMEMTIDSIRVILMNYQRVVILKEKNVDRYLPIWIGPAEADAIAIKLQDVSVPRPLTHDLLRLVITALGASVDSIIICDLQSDTFFAKVILQVDGKKVEIDARPSDAIALAVRTKVPIYAENHVLDKAGIVLDKETGEPVSQTQPQALEPGAPSTPKKVDEEEVRRMSAFKEFIDTLDLEDFGKGGSKAS
ncbi:MAG: bifunctional nuclease family protein [Chloroflexota bacterium]